MTNLLTVKQVADTLRVDETTVRRWIHQGDIDAITLPNHGKRKVHRIKEETLASILSGTIAIDEYGE